MSEPRGAINCISGGVDSVTTTYYVNKVLKPKEQLLIFCDYKQRTYQYEEFCIRRISEELKVPLKIVDLRWLGDISTSVLTHPEKEITETKEEDLWNPEKARQRILKWWDPCLPPGSLISCDSGWKPIEEIGLGDMVLGHDGFYHSVARVYQRHYAGRLISVTTTFGRKVSLTPNHPVLAKKRTQTARKPVAWYKRDSTQARWIHAGALEVGDVVLYPIVKSIVDRQCEYPAAYLDVPVMKREGMLLRVYGNGNRDGMLVQGAKPLKSRIESDKEFLRLCGYYVSDGTSNPFSFYFGRNEIEYAQDVSVLVKEKLELEMSVRRKGNHIEVGGSRSRLLESFFKGLFGRGRGIRLPGWMLMLPRDKQVELVKGLWRGDGTWDAEGFRFSTASLVLAYQVRDILLRLGILSSVHIGWKQERSVGYTAHVGGVSARKLAEMLGEDSAIQESWKHGWSWIDHDFAYYPIRRLDENEYVGSVHNLEVEGSNSYVTPSFAVHNCRNAILLLVGLAHAESFYIGKGERYDVYIGIRRETPVAMKDNTPAFLEEMNRAAEQATHHGGYRLLAPLITYDKDKVVKLGEELGVPWEYTYSCYSGYGFRKVGGRELPVHCNKCSNCKRRRLAFKDAGVTDPSVYAE